jgi:hypothetical protein
MPSRCIPARRTPPLPCPAVHSCCQLRRDVMDGIVEQTNEAARIERHCQIGVSKLYTNFILSIRQPLTLQSFNFFALSSYYTFNMAPSATMASTGIPITTKASKDAGEVLLADLETQHTKPLCAQMSRLNSPLPNPPQFPISRNMIKSGPICYEPASLL